ncbi:hypothetical protein, partial [Acidiphilium sp.]|uniref:hypothetical protein n=1 Tax=Acidiphilium sp. TaxID=527 RepID=UPI003D028804
MVFESTPVFSSQHRSMRSKRSRTALIVCALLGSTALTSAYGQTACSWTGAANDGNWLTAGNWSGCGGAYP